ncbi:TonB-dependent siderophore receptor [Rhizomicrobium palustre]
MNGAAILAVAAIGLASPVWAGEQTYSINVAAGSLDYVLTQLASQTGHRIVFDPSLVAGLKSSGISGNYNPEAAFEQVLAGTDLLFKVSEGGEWIILARNKNAAPRSVSGKLLSTVRVQADGKSFIRAGDNGSSDPIATEGTGSYTAKATVLASKTPLSIQETPAAVSVMTRQMLDDRQITSLSDSLSQLPGITVAQGGIISRGFAITNIQIDGGSPINVGQNSSDYRSDYSMIDDLSIYDSVALLRGSAGQFTGVGDPGGVISLERKRPLDHEMVAVEQGFGSYDHYRTVVDASSPFLFGDLMRARLVLTRETNNYFYDIASRSLQQGYLNVELDPTPSTTVNLGMKVNSSRNTPWSGLPTLDSGAIVRFPRNACLCTPWSYVKTSGQEYFAEVGQKLGEDWSFHLNASANIQHSKSEIFQYKIGRGYTGVVAGDPFSTVVSTFKTPTKSNQYLLDASMNGKFSVLGVDVDVTGGTNVQTINQKITGTSLAYWYNNADIINFDPNNFPKPADSQYYDNQDATPLSKQTQAGGYLTVRISPVNWLHLTVGERYSYYSFKIMQYGQLTSSSYDNLPTPSFGLVVDLSKDTSLFATTQSIFDRGNYLKKSGGLVDPSTGSNMEAGIKQSWDGGKLIASLSGYYLKKNNIPNFDPTAGFSIDPTTQAQCCFISDGTQYEDHGVEFSLQGALTDRLQTDISYTFSEFNAHNGYLTSNSPVPLTAPKHMAKIWFSWRPEILDDKLVLGFGGHLESKLTASAETISWDPVKGKTVYIFTKTPRPGFGAWDAMVKYDITENISAQLNVTNVFDQTYFSSVQVGSGNIYAQPRSYLLTLRGQI